MAIKIEWQDPDDDNVTLLEINRSTDKHGSYSVLATTDATNDGEAKSSSNSWVISYIDSTGSINNWYKMRMYDGTNTLWSDYSDPITGKQEIKLCTVDEVKKVLDTVGRWTDDEVFDAVEEVEESMYVEMGTPIKSIYSYVGQIGSNLQDTYYLGEEKTYRVDRLFYGTTTMHEYFLDDGYKTNLRYGMIRLLPVASGGPELSTECTVEVRFVPKIYNRVAVYRVAVFLLEKLDMINRGSVSRELEVANTRLAAVERILSDKIGFNLSSAYQAYDPIYGVQKKKLTQNHNRNKYIGSYGWD